MYNTIQITFIKLESGLIGAMILSYDRVMQLNWLYYVAYASWYHWNCGRTQHKAATINQLACPSYSLYVQLLWYPMYYPGGMKARVSRVQRSKPYSILVPHSGFEPGRPWFRIMSGDHYTTTAHIWAPPCCTVRCFISWRVPVTGKVGSRRQCKHCPLPRAKQAEIGRES